MVLGPNSSLPRSSFSLVVEDCSSLTLLPSLLNSLPALLSLVIRRVSKVRDAGRRFGCEELDAVVEWLEWC